MKNDKSRLLILDLDETLIHATEQPLGQPADFRLAQYHVYRRPHLHAFVTQVAETYELAVWSSASPDYVAGVVSSILPKEVQPAFVWGRERCTRRFDHEWQEEYYRKNLSKVKRLGYDIDSVLIVEDTPQKVEQHYGNAVYVRPFCGEPGDDELLHLAKYLQSIANVENYRRLEKRGWRLKFKNEEM